VVKKW